MKIGNDDGDNKVQEQEDLVIIFFIIQSSVKGLHMNGGWNIYRSSFMILQINQRVKTHNLFYK